MKKILLVCISILYTLSLQAQTEDKKWNIGLHGSANQYRGDLGNNFYDTDMPLYASGGVSVSRYLGSHIDLNFLATKGKFGFSRPSGHFNREVTTATLNVRFHILAPRFAVRPYLFVGGGAMLFDKNLTITEPKVDYATPAFGAGINFRLSPSVMFNIQETFLYSNNDRRDGLARGEENDAFLMHMVGFTFNFGKKHDLDKDGVTDRNDKCANTPLDVAVDKNGCPLDKDKDGVADYVDACPNEAGTDNLKGCPDKDNDGLSDLDDRCPDLAGTIELKGCPDKDKDGLADIDDRCPELAGAIALKGCPDADGDGVADLDDKCADTKAGYKVDATGCTMDNDKDKIINDEDRCPDAFGIASLQGCPDADGDGVADIDDRCPNAKGNLSNKGCPEITKEDVKKITQIASKIFFETNSDQLKVASLVQLDELSNLLKKYESANLVIAGHCDDVGEDAYNLTLSQKRTESVKTYLMGKGIMESRLTAIGYGETMPVADNKTSTGRAKNRRVELKTSY